MTPCLCKFLLGPSTANNVRRAFRFLEQWEEKKSFCNCMFIGDLPYGWGSCTHTRTRTHICTWRRGSVVYQRITHAYPATMMSETLYRFCLAILTWVLTIIATTTSSTTTTISTTSSAAALLWMNQQQLCDGESEYENKRGGKSVLGGLFWRCTWLFSSRSPWQETTSWNDTHTHTFVYELICWHHLSLSFLFLFLGKKRIFISWHLAETTATRATAALSLSVVVVVVVWMKGKPSRHVISSREQEDLSSIWL